MLNMYDCLYVLRNSLFGKKKMTKRDFFYVTLWCISIFKFCFVSDIKTVYIYVQYKIPANQVNF